MTEAKGTIIDEESVVECPECGHDAFGHANDSRIVGCTSDRRDVMCGCRWLLWEILRDAANKHRIATKGEPFDDKYHENGGN